jgi:hypothetical protein
MRHLTDAASFCAFYGVHRERQTGRSAPPERKERTMGQRIVKLSVEVRSGTARFRVGVQAESIRRALCVVGARYPASEVAVVFPIEPEGFFLKGPALAGVVETEHPKELAA